jgi:hypothetical protein
MHVVGEKRKRKKGKKPWSFSRPVKSVLAISNYTDGMMWHERELEKNPVQNLWVESDKP